MEFAWTKEQESYRASLKQACVELLPENWNEIAIHSFGSSQQIDYSLTFCSELAERGLLVQQWPREWGGGGGDPWQQFILAEEMALVGEPRGPQYMNVNWIGPAIMRAGTPEQQSEHLGRIASGKVIWSQGFTEPSGGSDLAALKTRAERTSTGYIVNGSKIFTSYAPRADYIFLLARTGDQRKNISIFLVPMNSPGISVQTYPGIVGEGHLNQVFFDDLEVPESMRLGPEGQAWDIITYALRFERVSVARFHVGRKALDVAVELLKREGRFDDTATRVSAGRIAAMLECGRQLSYFVIDQRTKQGSDDVNGNIARVAVSDACIDLQNFILDYLPDSVVAGGNGVLHEFFRANLAATIAAGAYEIQLNLIAQGALDLPRSN